MNAARVKGACLCGACRFTAVPDAMEADVCHCTICRKWSGGINMAVNCQRAVWNEDAPLRTYRSSNRGERVFCGSCGTNLYWRGLDDDPGEQSIGLMVFDHPGDFAVARQILIEEKPSTYDLAGDPVTLTGAQVRSGAGIRAEERP